MAQTKRQLISAILAEWKDAHHNATTLHTPMDVAALEADDYLYWLCDHTVFMCDVLREQVREQYGIDLDFCQLGRGGATIAPAEWVQESWGSRTLLLDDAVIALMDYRLSEGLAEYNALRKVLAILRLNNEFWRAAVADLPYQWSTRNAED